MNQYLNSALVIESNSFSESKKNFGRLECSNRKKIGDMGNFYWILLNASVIKKRK